MAKGFEEWKENQERFYREGFRNREQLLLTEGTKSGIHPRKVGYTFIYRHPKSISRQLAAISKRLANKTRCVIYPGKSIHVCALDENEEYKTAIRRDENSLSYLDKQFGQQLCNIARSLINRNRHLSVYLSDILFNPEAVIVKGILKDASVYDFSSELLEVCKREGVLMMNRFPWGAHTTLIRNFGGQEREIAKLEGQKLYESALEERTRFSSTESRFQYLDVCFFDCGPERAKFKILERFQFIR